jgi:hemerythrin
VRGARSASGRLSPEGMSDVALMEWNSRLRLDLATIDQQHRELVGMINDLDHAMGAGLDRAGVDGILSSLEAYSHYHFGLEESLLETHKYPGIEGHRSEHQAFVRNLSEFRVAHRQGHVDVSLGVMAFLSHWLHEHICGTDRGYAPFLIARGVK